MIDHYWTVLCSNSAIDKDTNSISLSNIIEQVTIVGQPPPRGQIGAIPNQATIVSLWGRSDEDTPERGTASYRIEFTDDRGSVQTNPHEIGVDLSEHQRFRTRANLNLLPVMGEGRHWIRVFLRDDSDEILITSIPYQIAFQEEAEAPAA